MEKILYKEVFKDGGIPLLSDYFPKLKHANGLKPVKVLILDAGKLFDTKTKTRYEFQTVKIYFEDK